MFFSLAPLALVVGCGSPAQDSRQQPDGVKDTATQESVTAAAPSVQQDRGSAESGGVPLPIGHLVVEIAGVRRECMVSFLGGGRVLTAGHCLAAGAPAQVGARTACPAGAAIGWLVRRGERLSVGPKRSSCQSVVNFFDGSEDSSDLAVIALGEPLEGSFPVVTWKVFAAVAINPLVSLVGPDRNKEGDSFNARRGYAFSVTGHLFDHNAEQAPGLSGAPVVLRAENEWLPATYQAVGIHLGRSMGTNRALRSERILSFLEQYERLEGVL